MDDLGFNKLGAAVLGAMLAFIGIRALAEGVVPEHHFEATYVPDVVLETTGAEEGPTDPLFNSVEFIAAMDVTRGEKVFKKCQSCHNADPGGANGTGPALYGVMGRQMGTHAGFGYSSAMTNKAAPWTWEEMDGFVRKPKEWLPGTAMNYIGIKKWEDRAAVMAYLNTRADSPLPLPVAAAAEVTDVAEDMAAIDELIEPVTGDETPTLDDVTLTDDSTEVAPENSAGEIGTEELTPAVTDAVGLTEDAAVDGPKNANDVLEFLNRIERAE